MGPEMIEPDQHIFPDGDGKSFISPSIAVMVFHYSDSYLESGK